MKITESDYANLAQMAKYGIRILAYEICALFKTKKALVIDSDGMFSVVFQQGAVRALKDVDRMVDYSYPR